MYNNDLVNELSSNFIEYAVAVNSDRSIPSSTDGLKPVARRIIYGAYDCGFKSDKPHVKCANVVGNVMADWHPHGDSSIYGALVRLSQNWIMRYPLIDFHGSNGNIDGDGPAHYRYTESRLAKLTEDGMLAGIKKDNVDFISNYSETKEEPIELPALFPNLLCNPNSGIGVALASSWGCANLGEVAQAIYDYMDGKEPMIYPDFPTGGILINKNEVPAIMQTGKGSVKLRAKYHIEKNNIIFTELPYGIGTEALMTQIGKLCEDGEIEEISDIRNESNKKGFRLVIECEKVSIVLKKLFEKTDLQTTFSYNQVALVNKTPTLLNLKDCIKIYINHNIKCIKRETEFDINKTKNRLSIVEGLIKALDIIDKIITMIKSSPSANKAKETLISWGFNEEQAKAILDMKLAKLAKLEKEELIQEKKELEILLNNLNQIFNNPEAELRKRLAELVKKYGDSRRTELIQLEEEPREEKKIEPVAIAYENGNIKRVNSSSLVANSLMVFTNKGLMYRLSVEKVTTKSQSISSLIDFQSNEKPIFVCGENTEAKYIYFVTKNGTIKKTAFEEYAETASKKPLAAIKLRENDSVVSAFAANNEDIVILSKSGSGVHFRGTEISVASRNTIGIKGITLKENDEVIAAMPYFNKENNLVVINENGLGKQINMADLPLTARATKGIILSKSPITFGCFISKNDNLLIVGQHKIKISDIPLLSRMAEGNQLIKKGK